MKLYWIIAASVIFGSSCQKRNFNNSKPEGFLLFGNQGFPSEVTGKRSCPSDKFKNTKSGDVTTKFYHWTNDINALQNPKKYLADILIAGISANKSGSFSGVEGGGLYLAQDPFQSATYGNILVTLAIKEGVSFPERKSNDSSRQFFDAGCPGIIYNFFYTRFRTNKVNASRALNLWDFAGVDPESVSAYAWRRKPVKHLDSPAIAGLLQSSLSRFWFEAILENGELPLVIEKYAVIRALEVCLSSDDNYINIFGDPELESNKTDATEKIVSLILEKKPENIPKIFQITLNKISKICGIPGASALSDFEKPFSERFKISEQEALKIKSEFEAIASYWNAQPSLADWK